MINKIIGCIKRCLPSVLNIANETLDLIEKELDVSNIQTHVRKSGNKIFIDVTIPRVSKDDLDFNFSKDSFTIEIKNRKISTS